MTDTSSQQTQQVSEEVREYLWSDEVYKRYAETALNHGLTNGLRGVGSIMLQLVEGKLQINDLPGKLVEVLKVDAEAAKRISLELAQTVLVQIADSISGLDEVVLVWGGELPETKEKPEKFVDNYLKGLIGLSDKHMHDRFASFLVKLIRKERSHDETVQMMMRPIKVAGLGLGQVEAEKLLDQFGEKVKGVEFEGEEVREVKEVREGEDVLTEPVVEAFGVEDAREIEEIKKSGPDLSPPDNFESVEEVVDTICDHEVFDLSDNVLNSRCKKIIDSRVRGVRDAFETRKKLERPTDKGGLGLSGRKLADMMEFLEKSLQVYQKSHTKHVETKRAEHGATQQEQKQQKEQLKKKEEQVLSKRYASLTGKAPTESVKPAAPPLGRASVSVSAQQQINQQEEKINTQRVRGAIESAKAKQPAKPQPKKVKPNMSDVKFERRLSSPIDELRTMDLKDFRRLASDAAQAATKIKDKVRLMEDQGYEKKIEAIKAWRESPVNQLYVKYSREALLNGKALADVLKSHQDVGKDALTDKELKAIMKINTDLRF